MTTEFTAGYESSKSPPLNYASSEISKLSSSPNKPPKVPPESASLTRRKSLTRSVYSKPRSKFGDLSYPFDAKMLEEKNASTLQENLAVNRTVPISPKAPLMASPGSTGEDEDEDEDEVDYEIIMKNVELSKGKRGRVTTRVLIEWFLLVCIGGCLVASLTVNKLRNVMIWGLQFWKWCVLVMVIICGMLVTKWFMHLLVFLIEINFLLTKKVLYFVYGLKKIVQVFIWLALVLLTWVLLINRGVQRSKITQKILDDVTWSLVSLLIGAFLWLLKTLLLKILASNFHFATFFDRIQESIFHEYVLHTLTGPPITEEAERVGRTASASQLSFRSSKSKGGAKKEVIDMSKLYKMKQKKASVWKMKWLIDAISNSGLSTNSYVLDESFDDGGAEQTNKEITNEMEATTAAYQIFRNVAEPGCAYIYEEDLLRFMIKEEVELLFPLFNCSETGRIDKKALTSWVVNVYQERKTLAHALNDSKTAIKQLNKLVTGIVVVVTMIVWLLLIEIATTKVLVLLSSQLVLSAFVFRNTCKNIFEAIMFVFVIHPFDVGDRCIVDGVQLLVEEMNILTTVFLKLDNEKVYYPNSVLAAKPISNYYRSPDMCDNVEFSIDFMTPIEKIGALKEKIERYLLINSQHWYADHTVVVKEIENVNNIKIAVFFTHKMNFQDYGEKTKRRTELVNELKKIFKVLNIRYNFLPQAVHLNHTGSDTSALHK